MNIGRILGILIIVGGIVFLDYFDFENNLIGFGSGLMVGLGVLLLIKGGLRKPLNE
ncbi:hypothetical protein GCM10023115_32410 [Pontixanthobacter gangjinensis]|uniref:hypothetical protein n=1 Tax=Christiangramia aestuarii TaxID=1028746 RepID=UPI0012E1B661|nr:hypothetical protein [Christiangramia aestuarii]